MGIDEISNKKFQIPISDFTQGGVIVGAIGSGKTTLRINILTQLIKKKISILDIDIKGDAPRLKSLNTKGRILIPGKNLYVNLFNKPNNMPTVEFIGVLNRSFIESLTSDDLSAPQKEILYSAIEKTVIKKGDLSTFFRNLILAGVEFKDIIDNKQEQSVFALMNKFNWLKNDLGHIFMISSEGITGKELAEHNIFLDLSEIANSTPTAHLRFLIDVIMTKMMIYYRYVESYNFNSSKSNYQKIIFIDEAHLIIPNSITNELTKLEEVITTLRYKGVSVIATTINQSIISSTLKDTGFFIQFRSNLNYLPVQSNLINSSDKLQDYQFYIMSKGTEYEKLKIKTIPIKSRPLNPVDYHKTIQQPKIQKSKSFVLNKTHFKIAQLETLIFSDLLVNKLREMFREIIVKDINPLFRSFKITNFFSDTQNLIWEASGLYLSNKDISPKLKTSVDLKGFLYEVLLALFYHLFRKLELQLLSNKIKNELKNKSKSSFLQLANFIDDYVRTLNYPSNNGELVLM